MIRIEPRTRKSPEIGVAPLVDCMLLLLIFFLLTSSFSEKLGITIKLPGSETARLADQNTIDVAVSESGEITFKGATLGTDELTAALKAAMAEGGKKTVFLMADRTVSIETAAEVIDGIRAAGLDSVVLAARAKQTDEGESNR